ncbi:hypothetical protein WN944_001583 [Citrus x changshan-huyou]|uniref:Reverse transcriptase Ty1/copia-type domain-containing protein n=1 Tax=Citrus x changshan-huyou TaxID=2935761 RepID=A0AAP0MEX8_9ROSI
MITRSKSGIFNPKLYTATLDNKEHDTIQKALCDQNWYQAMRNEYKALIKNKTWSLVPRSVEHKIIGNKWMFRIKQNTDGSIAKYKARIVAKGFQQTEGVDYFETFSPVVKPCIVRIVLSLNMMNKWVVRQVEVNNAFLNGELTEDVYMRQLEGFVDVQKPGHVCKLRKALYGLKQAPRAWYDKLKNSLIKTWNFQNSKADTSLFFKEIHGFIILILIYVNDILITGANSKELERFISEFSRIFALKDLGTLSYFLGIEIAYAQDNMYLSQKKYIRDLRNKADMLECKSCDTPMVTGHKLQKEVKAPTLQHILACKRVLGYLKATEDYGLKFSAGGEMKITGYTDADWACDVDDSKSIGAYCIYFGNNLVSWSSKKQTVVTRSSAESEYRALASASAEIAWIQSLLEELKIECTSLPIIWCDNVSATELAKNPVYHSRTKHIELDIHFVRDKVLARELEISYIPSEEQIADILTKPLTFTHFNYFRAKLKVHPCDYAIGYDLHEANQINIELEKYRSFVPPDTIKIKNSYKENNQRKHRKPNPSKLKPLDMEVDGFKCGANQEKMNNEYEEFLRDLMETLSRITIKITHPLRWHQ